MVSAPLAASGAAPLWAMDMGGPRLCRSSEQIDPDRPSCSLLAERPQKTAAPSRGLPSRTVRRWSRQNDLSEIHGSSVRL